MPQQEVSVRLKLAGRTHVNQQTGQLTSIFESNPQQPFEKLTIHTDGGPMKLQNDLAGKKVTLTFRNDKLAQVTGTVVKVAKAEQPEGTTLPAQQQYEQFLILTYLWAPAWAAVVLIGFLWVRPARLWTALAAWAIGTAVSLLFVNYSNIYPGARAFNDPLISALHGADLSGLVSMAVAAGAYTVMLRLGWR